MADVRATTKSESLEKVGCRALGSELLCERAKRIWTLARWIGGFSELRNAACNREAVRAAAWFQDAWCIGGSSASPIDVAALILSQPTDSQRRRSADIAAEFLVGVVDAPTRETACRAITLSGVRGVEMPEALILSEATCLDSIGPIWLCGQAAKCAGDHQSFGAMIALWERQTEYGYWSKRIEENLRFGRSRALARHRCEALDEFLPALRRQLDGSDRHVSPEPNP